MSAPSGMRIPGAPDRRALLAIARRSLGDRARVRWDEADWSGDGIEIGPDLRVEPRGVFVTLRDPGGELRGCIGTTRAQGALFRVVSRYAVAAGFEDPRFPPVLEEEIPLIGLHVSILAPDRPVGDVREIRLGVDGVTLSHPGGSAIFLPEVATETGWNRETLLKKLSRKAGLDESAWSERSATLLAFETFAFGDEEEP